MWAPPVINWFINPINYSYKMLFAYHKPELLELQTNLATVWRPHIVHLIHIILVIDGN